MSTQEVGNVVLYSPDVHAPPIELDLDNFMQTWHVTHSTLSLWTTKKDVTITYTMKPSSSGDSTVRFDDVVEYRSRSDTPSSKPSRVIGVDTLLTPESDLTSRTADGGDAASGPRSAQPRFKWRGKGWLAIASSRWQVLGYSRDTSPDNPTAWVVTYFEKTLFTPPGLDIYARTARGLPDELVEEIISKLKALGGNVAKLAATFFEVERSGWPMGQVGDANARKRLGPVDKADVITHIALSPS
ncbi:hypothetical protein BN946_scf184467.g4 [Trametes cinnabarina]|uniref:Uncharacterized protein n=1 Tax=Pycnoporus cinnabarinus TaxID=5643 RepID=A0A060SUU1_PYCCI|nr:hypothetical protein BN946_scf184467.g4 [Trametes cinnabarina]